MRSHNIVLVGSGTTSTMTLSNLGPTQRDTLERSAGTWWQVSPATNFKLTKTSHSQLNKEKTEEQNYLTQHNIVISQQPETNNKTAKYGKDLFGS